MAKKNTLWQLLSAYEFEHLVPPHLTDRAAELFGGASASRHAFAAKVARKSGWDVPFALRAIHEYKKFVYLGVVSDFYVTPSKVIDQVWHEHLLFTKGYRDFCREVVGRDFDHHPELFATADQTGVFGAQYRATLDLYRAEFQEEPPLDIWGVPKYADGKATPGEVPKKKPADGDGFAAEPPLYAQADDGSAHHHGHGFGGSGHFAGAGASGSWTDSSSHGHGHGHGGFFSGDSSGHSGDGGGGHGGDGGGGGGGDGGSSCGGGGGCSSGCGGGGCGGS